MSYKSVWDFGRAGKANYSVHAIGEYPSKIRPIVISKIVERFSNKGDVVLDPFCGGGTVAVECKLQGRSSINFDINPNAIELTKQRLDALTKDEMKNAIRTLIKDFEKDFQTILGNSDVEYKSKFKQVQAKKEVEKLKNQLQELENGDSEYYKTNHITGIKDVRELNLPEESVDAVITDIPYASMIKYSDLPNDLSIIENYPKFLEELQKGLEKAGKALKKEKYFVIFVADYRVGASRVILPVHADVIQIMQDLGFNLFDNYVWRYYRSGAFRPFGKPPYQAMNIHIYILCFYKPDGNEEFKPNRPVRYRKRLIQKLNNSNNSKDLSEF